MRAFHLKSYLITLFVLAHSSQLLAGECTAKSDQFTTPLLELYTSEGCSSCPPADRWLSGIQMAGYTTDKVVPLAFHVDYWDYIGWKDRYAKPQFTARQREQARLGYASFVYTPQVTINGADFRGWQSTSRFDQAVEDARKQPAKANLAINIKPLPEAGVAISITAHAASAELGKQSDVYIAVYENHLKSEVKTGENAGRELKHDFVVRDFYGPFRLDEQTGPWQRNLTWKQDTKNPDIRNREIGVATFVQNRTSGVVLQALSLKACP